MTFWKTNKNQTWKNIFLSYLKHKMSVLCILQPQILIVKVRFQTDQKLVLSVDVCCQDQGAQLLLNVLSAIKENKPLQSWNCWTLIAQNNLLRIIASTKLPLALWIQSGLFGQSLLGFARYNCSTCLNGFRRNRKCRRKMLVGIDALKASEKC